ncbi:MAG: hypothetical protein JXA30_23210 [Deltaproteobacteria bacterium]|nr:hypothetical protein [Deltaproteobacteria bacterium]
MKQALSDSTQENHNQTVCNRPPPDRPLDFGPADQVSIVGNKLVIPARIREHKDPSGFTAQAMVFAAGELSKRALKPSWGILSSKGVLEIAIASIVPSGAKSDEPITFAIKVTDASGAARWSDSMQIERVDKGWTVRPYGSNSKLALSVRSATTMQGDLPPVESPRPPIPADEVLEMLDAAGVSTSAPLAEIAERAATGQSFEATDSAGDKGGEAMTNGLPTVVCFWQAVQMSDSGVGEDYLNYDWWWPSAGMLAMVSGSTNWLGYLDVWGCTPPLNITSGYHTAYLVSASYPYWASGSGVTVDTDNDGMLVFTMGSVYITEGIDQLIPWWPQQMEHFNINLMAVYGLHFNPGIVSTTYEFHAKSTIPGGSQYAGGEVHIATGDSSSKWLVGHEMGHAFFDKNTTKHPPVNYSICSTFPCNAGCPAHPGDPDSHGYNSIEYVSTNVNEGLASFYSAAAFNSMDQTDCWFGSPNWSCSTADANHPKKYMESKCVSDPWQGMGVEIDWVRQFWAVRTYNAPNHPSTNDMLNWINQVIGFHDDNGYFALNAAAEFVGGSLWALWDANKSRNGIMH